MTGSLVALLSVWALTATPVASVAGWAPSEPYLAPVQPMRAVTLAQLPTQRWLAGHRGVDLDATVGQTVFASAAGTVTFAGVVVDRPVLTVRHNDGALSSVEPVEAWVAVGDRVERGDAIGEVHDAKGHCAPEVCVHWGIRVNGEYIDPLNVLAGYGRVVLLPRSEGARNRRRCVPLSRGSERHPI